MKTGLRPVTWAAIIGGSLALATAGLLVFSVLGSLESTCEVCMTFRGQTQCRTASAPTEQEATRTATDNACAVLGARGINLSVECGNTPPARVTCGDAAPASTGRGM